MSDRREVEPPAPAEVSSGHPTAEFNWGKLPDILGLLFHGVIFDRMLSELLAIAAQADLAVAEVLAIQFGRDEQCWDSLVKVMGHVPSDMKLSLLEEVISSRGWMADFPEVGDTLRALQKHRNQLAHSYNTDTPGAPRDDNVYRRRKHWRGRESEFEISAEDVFALVEKAKIVLSQDLLEIARRGLPQNDVAESPERTPQSQA